MKRKNILLVVLLMAVGFAAVSTTLYINGQTKINANQNDFNVYYSDAYVNGEQDKSVITDNTHISFTTELSTLGEKYVLDYEVTNGSKNYDAELVMECTQGNEYLTVTNEFDDDSILKAKALREGKLTLELIKSNTGDDIEVTIECTISANAIERDSLGIENRSEITVEAVDSNNTNLNAKAYEITGSEENELLDSLVETGYIENVDEVDALIEVKSDDFEDFATTTFDVSSIASEGDKVVILHFNESTQEWEYVSEEIVDENGKVTSDFTSYSPVAFVVKKEDGSFEYVTLKAGFYDATGKLIAAWEESGIDISYDYTNIANASNNAFYAKTSGFYITNRKYPNTTKIVIPDGTTQISAFAFWGTTNVSKFIIPDSVYYIKSGAFMGANITSVGSKGSNASIELPNKVTSIYTDTFRDTDTLTNVLLSDSGVTYIGRHSFAYNDNLVSVVLPNNLESLDYGAFSSCPNLTSIEYKGVVYTSVSELRTALSANSVSIGSYALSDTGLTD